MTSSFFQGFGLAEARNSVLPGFRSFRLSGFGANTFSTLYTAQPKSHPCSHFKQKTYTCEYLHLTKYIMTSSFVRVFGLSAYRGFVLIFSRGFGTLGFRGLAQTLLPSFPSHHQNRTLLHISDSESVCRNACFRGAFE